MYLLDTNALLWWIENDPTLSIRARNAISSRESEVYVSAVSPWEIAIKVNAGRMRVPGDLLYQIQINGFRHLPITLEHGIASGALPRLHGDPFDRMLIAQALANGLTLITRDQNIMRYNVPILEA